MISYKKLRAAIKDVSTQQSSTEILAFVGYEIDRNYKFKLRDENTPSVSRATNGNIKDFGSGWSGDIVSVLHEYKDIPLGEATVYVAKLLNIDINNVRYQK